VIAEFGATPADHERTLLQRPMKVTDREIDALAYEPYRLTEDEIKIVEGTAT